MTDCGVKAMQGSVKHIVENVDGSWSTGARRQRYH